MNLVVCAVGVVVRVGIDRAGCVSRVADVAERVCGRRPRATLQGSCPMSVVNPGDIPSLPCRRVSDGVTGEAFR